MVLFTSIIAAVTAIVLFRQMWLGMLDYIRYGEAIPCRSSCGLRFRRRSSLGAALRGGLAYGGRVLARRPRAGEPAPASAPAADWPWKSTSRSGWRGCARLLLIVVRVPIAYSMILIGIGGTAFLSGPALLNHLKAFPYSTFSIYDLSVIPMFVLMGGLASRSGLPRSFPRGKRLDRPLPRRCRDGGGRRLRRLRRGLRLLAGDCLHDGAGGAAGAPPLRYSPALATGTSPPAAPSASSSRPRWC